MEFGNFSDQNFIIFFSVIVLLVVVIALVITFFIISVQNDNKFQKQVDYESTTTRIYIIDVKKNKIIQLNKSDMGNKIVYDLFSFYTSFHPNDSERVKNWIFQICVNPKSVDEYLEADILLNNNKKLCFTLLRLLDYNAQTGLIHLESHILKYITPKNAPKKKNENRTPTGIVKRSQILSIINHNKSLSGYTFCIRFFYARQKVISNDKIERYMIMNLKNAIYPYASNPKLPRQILDNGEPELFVFDLRISNREAALQLANSISRSIKKQMEVNGFSGYIDFAIGIVENGQFYQDYDSIEEKVKEACISGQTNGNQVVFYQRNANANSDMVKYAQQIEHLLADGTLRYLYRPIINSKNGQTIGYFEYVKAYNSPFSNFSEMSKYAARINKNLELFALIAKSVITKFANERPSAHMSLFLNVSMVDINNISRIIAQIPSHSKVNIVLVFDEQEINENSNNVELLINALTNLKNQGFELALSLKDKNLLLDDKVYFLFHYFVVGSAMMEEVKHNNRIRLSLYALIESLLKYNRPIIATDLEGWQAVELIFKSGISYISSDVVAPSNDMLLPVDKKKMEKVVQMADKYL
jgi:EAL domain-containing protein (putative c-di-GMP-specific phosphodiesterase class I)